MTLCGHLPVENVPSVIIIQTFTLIYVTLVKGEKQQHTHGCMQSEGSQAQVNIIT